MKIKVLVFGVVKDMVGSNVVEVDIDNNCTVGELNKILKTMVPKLPDSMIAVNATYAQDDQIIGAQDEIALIPPTNGG